MRTVIALAACAVAMQNLGLAEGLWAQLPDSDERAAIEISCSDLAVHLREDCGKALMASFAEGRQEAEPIVRLHCTRWVGAWGEVREEPSEICNERYGGWVRS